MAAMIISRRAHPASTLLHALRLSAAASSSRSFAADAGQETSVDVGRRPAPAPQRRRSAAVPAPRRARAHAGDLLPTFFSDPWDPFNPGRALSQMLSLADQFLDVPFTRGGGGGLRRGWDAREDETALYVKVEMPGLGKEDVKVWVEGNTLVIQGEEEEEEDNDDDEGGGEGGEGATGEAAAEGKGKRPQRRRRFGGRVELPAKGYKLDEIRAEMQGRVAEGGGAQGHGGRRSSRRQGGARPLTLYVTQRPPPPLLSPSRIAAFILVGIEQGGLVTATRSSV